MASEQWLLNDTTVNSGAYFTAVGSSYKLKNNNQTRSRTTSSPTPYEGAGCYLFTTNNTVREIQTSANGDVNGAKFVDYYVYVPTGLDVVDYQFMLCANDGAVEYSWAAFFEDGSIGFGSYDGVYGLIVTRVSSAGAITVGAWNRLAAKSDTYGILELKAFRGSNINGSTADTTITTTSYQSSLGFSAYVKLGVTGGPFVTYFPYADDIKFDTAAYPTRGTAYTASGTSTITATGTAAMSNARVGAGSGTGTATGAGAASRGRSVTGSASVTASATAAMSSTQVIGASGTGTASGSAAGAITAVVTISGSATITGTGTSTASVAMAQTATAIGTVIATSSVDFIVTPPITLQSNGTVIADSSGEMAKTMPVESTGTATATSQAGATHTYYIFKPPTREIAPLSLDPYAELVGYYQGKTLVKRDGVWKLVQNKRQDWLDQCEYVFPGGRENRVNGTQKTELESAGYTVETRTS